jgi:two-component system response regulator AtoC
MASTRPAYDKRPEHILVVEGEHSTRHVLSGFLAGRGYRAHSVCPDEAVPRFENSRPGAVILNLSARTALDVLATFHRIDRLVPILVITDRQQFALLEQSAPTAMLISRPFDGRELEAALASALRHRPVPLSRAGAADPAEALDAVLLGNSPKMAQVRSLVERVAESDVTVLVRGETGTGKELVARGLRAASPRRDGPFVKVNCAALPTDLLESELFGFERGAFTGALQSRPGRFEVADEGTMFLDEIGEMSVTLQAKLLQVLQDGEFSRLGGADVRVDVRIIAATNCDLESAVAAGLFREDLYFRINVVEITLPPLRERKEDIPLLAGHFLQQQAPGRGRATAALSAETLDLFQRYDWPGNVRELENLVKRIVVLGDEGAAHEAIERRQTAVPSRAAAAVETPAAAQAAPTLAASDGSRATSLKDIGRTAAREAERIAILDMLERTRWNRKEAAEILGISYKALLYKIKDNRLDEAS